MNFWEKLCWWQRTAKKDEEWAVPEEWFYDNNGNITRKKRSKSHVGSTKTNSSIISPEPINCIPYKIFNDKK